VVENKIKTLQKLLIENKVEYAKSISRELGYCIRDSASLIEESIIFLQYILDYYDNWIKKHDITYNFYPGRVIFSKKIISQRVPKGKILMLLPANAPFPLGINLPISALLVGNKVFLRMSSKVPKTSTIIYNIYEELFDYEVCCYRNISATDAIIDGFKRGINSIYYSGSSKYVLDVLNIAHKHNIDVIYDSEGNGFAIVDKNYSMDDAINIVLRGATRCNGLLCSKINGVLVHRDIYKEFEQKLVDRFSQLRWGDPLDPFTEIGPLPSDKIIGYITKILRDAQNEGGIILIGGKNVGNIFIPTIISNALKTNLPDVEIPGPVIWIDFYSDINDIDDVLKRLSGLNITVLSNNKTLIEHVKKHIGKLYSRLVVNGDPTIESPFMPWGGIRKSGNTGCFSWFDKFTVPVTVEESYGGEKYMALSIVLKGPENWEFREIEIPDIEYGCIVKMIASGICGTDKQIFKGKILDIPYPIIPGHENVGCVLENHGVKDYTGKPLKEGDIVTWCVTIPCGKCNYCRKGKTNLCDRAFDYGITLSCEFPPYVFGGWSTISYIPPEAQIIRLSSNIDPLMVVLSEPFACTGKLEHLIRSDMTVGIIGSGTMAIMSTIRTILKNATPYCIIKHERLISFFKNYAANVLLYKYSDTFNANLLKHADSFDIIVDTVGDEKSIDLALRLVKKGGILFEIGGYYGDYRRINIKKLIEKEISIYSQIAYNVEEFHKSIEALRTLYNNDMENMVRTIPFTKEIDLKNIIENKEYIKSVFIFK